MGAVFMVAAAAYQAYQSHAQGQYAQAVANQNAQVAEQYATRIQQDAEIDVARQRDKTNRLVAEQRATLGATGVDLGSGTPLDLFTDTYGMGEYDALTIRNNAAREAWGIRNQATQYRAQGSLDKLAGNQQAFGSLLSGAGQIYGMAGGY